MIYRTPPLADDDLAVLDLIAGQRDRLRVFTQNSPRRWLGSLRRSTFARAIQGSNSIEGYKATIDDAIAAVEQEPPLDAATETWAAVQGYRNALTYIMQAASDPFFRFSTQLLKSLHFMMLGFDLSKSPGQWRPGSIYIRNEASDEVVYEGPDAELIPELIDELVAELGAESRTPNLVRAAMAHLNLTMIHPFRDGNGRMARALQTLVLARDGLLHPVYSSIEEWLGRNTQAYYAILGQTGQGRWSPERDALPWVRFCLRAHFQQAATLIRRNDEYGKLFEGIEALILRHKLPDRAALPAFDAALGFRLTNERYRKEAEVSEIVATRDLKRLCDAGLLEAHGEKRGRTYRGAKALRDLNDAARIMRPLEDPYDVIRSRAAAARPRLPGL